MTKHKSNRATAKLKGKAKRITLASLAQIMRKEKGKEEPQTTREAGFSLYKGIFLTPGQYMRELSALLRACHEEIASGTRQECEEYQETGAGAILVSFVAVSGISYEDIETPFGGGLCYLSDRLIHKADAFTQEPRLLKNGERARICRDDQRTLCGDAYYNDGVILESFQKAASWYETPAGAAAWIQSMQDEAKQAGETGNRGNDEPPLFPERKTKQGRRAAGINSEPLTHIAVFAAKIGDQLIKSPVLRDFKESLATSDLFRNEEILPAPEKEEDIPQNIYGLFTVIQTGIIDDLKAGGTGHYKTDIYAFCKTLGIEVKAKNIPLITKAFEQLGRLAPDYGDDKIRMNTISASLDPKTGVIEFYGSTIVDMVMKIREYNTEKLNDPGKEFAPKNVKADLLKQRDVDAKNAILQVIAPGIELRGIKKGENAETVYHVSYRRIINETGGFWAAWQEARKKSAGYEARFLRRKLDNIVSYLGKYTEYPERFRNFHIDEVQPRKQGGSSILDTVLYIRHEGLKE